MAKVDVNQWRFRGSQQNLLGGQRVTLRNEVEDKSIRFGERESGINLVWDDAADLANVSIHRRDEAGGGTPLANMSPFASTAAASYTTPSASTASISYGPKLPCASGRSPAEHSAVRYHHPAPRIVQPFSR